LDGVRGVAIALVLLFHFSILGIGWVGVDVFFVLSGYLITRILRKQREQDDYWKVFYIKRAKRIAPPLLVLIIASVFLIGANWGTLGYLFFIGNIVNFTHYNRKILEPLWSLAIEEHYYLLWPIAVRGAGRPRLLTILACAFVAEPLLRLAVTHRIPEHAVYALTPFHLDGIIAGSALALIAEGGRKLEWLKQHSGKAAAFIALLYLLLKLAMPHVWTRQYDSFGFNGFGYTVIAAGVFCLVAYLITQDSWLAKLLSFAPLVFLGRISYGLYLYHQVVWWEVARKLYPNDLYPREEPRLLLPCLAISLLIAWVSYRFLEMPISRLGGRRLQPEAAETPGSSIAAD